MNIVQQAWKSKWDQVQGLLQQKTSKLGTCAGASFADTLSATQAAMNTQPVQTVQAVSQSAASASPSVSSKTITEGVSSKRLSSTQYEHLISAASAKYGVDESLIKGVVKAESGFNTQAVSSAGAMGLMQLMPGTAQGLGVTDAHDPAQNIDAGTRYLARLLRHYGGDARLALTAYNRGMGNVGSLTNTSADKVWNDLSTGAQKYALKVLEYARGYGYSGA